MPTVTSAVKASVFPTATQVPTKAPLPSPTTASSPAATSTPTIQPTPTKAFTETPWPAEPQRVDFLAEDGQALVGTYYPGRVDGAPLVVLMHWAPGDASDWEAIAVWLQNRGVRPEKATPANKPWLDAQWFPPMPEGRSYAVFTFTFRGCEGGCRQFARGAWLLDAKAALRTARGLKGIDPQRIVAVGASIGADGAADACYTLNEEFPNGCQGAFSLSPGNYLTVPYADAVMRLGSEASPKPAWCFYAEKDTASAKACQEAKGENYRAWRYAGEAHGMMLVAPNIEPAVLPLLLEFLEKTVG